MKMWLCAAFAAMVVVLCGNPAGKPAIAEDRTRLEYWLSESFQG